MFYLYFYEFDKCVAHNERCLLSTLDSKEQKERGKTICLIHTFRSNVEFFTWTWTITTKSGSHIVYVSHTDYATAIKKKTRNCTLPPLTTHCANICFSVPGSREINSLIWGNIQEADGREVSRAELITFFSVLVKMCGWIQAGRLAKTEKSAC